MGFFFSSKVWVPGITSRAYRTTPTPSFAKNVPLYNTPQSPIRALCLVYFTRTRLHQRHKPIHLYLITPSNSIPRLCDLLRDTLLRRRHQRYQHPLPRHAVRRATDGVVEVGDAPAASDNAWCTEGGSAAGTVFAVGVWE